MCERACVAEPCDPDERAAEIVAHVVANAVEPRAVKPLRPRVRTRVVRSRAQLTGHSEGVGRGRGQVSKPQIIVKRRGEQAPAREERFGEDRQAASDLPQSSKRPLSQVTRAVRGRKVEAP